METVTGPRALDVWGWDPDWEAAFEPFGRSGLEPGRVVAQHRGRWIVVSAAGDSPAEPTGRFRHEASDGELPAAGDWVACRMNGSPRIDAVLPRRSVFRRKAAGSRLGAQVIAANVETLLVATSMNGDLNPRRLERYVAMAHEAGVRPVVVLTKADLSDDPDSIVARVSGDLHVPAVGVSARLEGGLSALDPYLLPGATVAVVGSSGVGKSTLLNALAGDELMATREIREDDSRGRHTTTHRELFRLPTGALLLDTPGMRELGLWDANEGLAETFDEITELAAACRFRDCRHEREPGCAVRAALEAGDLDERRLRSHRRLSKELADQPPALRREAERRFSRAVRNASGASMARKTYREER